MSSFKIEEQTQVKSIGFETNTIFFTVRLCLY